jgi:DNA-binding beta-propeller fold protein YncE
LLRIGTFIATATVALAAAGATSGDPVIRIVDRIAIGGEARWDYLTVDSANHRLFVAHGDRTEVIDTVSDQRVGRIENTPGVHGIAIAGDLGLGFISNGKDDSVTVFDLASLESKARIKVGANPDAIVYLAASHRVVTFNGRSHDATVIDAQKLAVVGTVGVGGKPEYAQPGLNGEVYFNVEDTNELLVLDTATLKIVRRHSLAPCEGPSGLAVDSRRRFYSVCENKMMLVSADDGRRLAQVPIGAGSDGVAWMDDVAYSANGADGTITAVRTGGQGGMEAFATTASAAGARTIAADPATHRLYLPTAEFKQWRPGERRTGVPDTFYVLVLEAK